MDDGGARRDRLARHGAFEHLEPGVGGAVAVVQPYLPVRQLLRHVDLRVGRNDQRSTDDHGPATDLERTHAAFRHPAVIAALSPLEHRGFAAFLEPPLIGDRARQRPFRGGANVAGLARHHLEIEALGPEQAFFDGHQHVEAAECGYWLDRHLHHRGSPPLDEIVRPPEIACTREEHSGFRANPPATQLWLVASLTWPVAYTES